MVLQATIDMLVGMKMTAMAAELSSQLQDSSFSELGFEDRLGRLVTAEWNRRQTNTVKAAHSQRPLCRPVRRSGRDILLRGQEAGQGSDAALLHL